MHFRSHAQPGQICKRNYEDPETGKITLCGEPLPEGVLTHVAVNGRSGWHLALCEKCREEFQEALLPWLSTAQTRGRLTSELLELPGKSLVSHTTLKAVLVETGRLARVTNGPLTWEQQLEAVEVMKGAEVREWVEEHS